MLVKFTVMTFKAICVQKFLLRRESQSQLTFGWNSVFMYSSGLTLYWMIKKIALPLLHRDLHVVHNMDLS